VIILRTDNSSLTDRERLYDLSIFNENEAVLEEIINQNYGGVNKNVNSSSYQTTQNHEEMELATAVGTNNTITKFDTLYNNGGTGAQDTIFDLQSVQKEYDLQRNEQIRESKLKRTDGRIS
jgi:hypothetical protein